MEIFKVEGNVKSLAKVHKEKKDVDAMIGIVTVANETGDKVTFVSTPEVLDGLRPEEKVVITMSRIQKTLGDSLKNE